MRGSEYPAAIDPNLVGTYPAVARAGGGYVWDTVLEYRVWCHPERGAPDTHNGDDYYCAFETYAEALAFSEQMVGAEPPLALIRQLEHINEPEPGVYVHIREPRIAEWHVEFLRRPKRTKDTIPAFFAPDAPANRLDILRGFAVPPNEQAAGHDPMGMTTDGIRWPAEFEPRRAAVHAVNQLDMQVSSSAVWKTLIRASEWPLWYANAANVHIDGDARDLSAGVRFTWRTFGVNLVSRVEEFVPEVRIAWTAKSLGVWVYHAWLIAPTESGCHVLTEETQHGFLSRAAKLFFPGRMERWHQRWLEGLAARATEHQ